MTLEVDTKLVEDALETVKLVGAKGRRIATCREEWRTNSTDRELRETHASRVEFASQFGDEVGVCRPGQG